MRVGFGVLLLLGSALTAIGSVPVPPSQNGIPQSGLAFEPHQNPKNSKDTPSLDQPARKKSLQEWCGEVSQSFKHLNWNLDPCAEVNWIVGGHSIEGRPLVYAEFGDPQAENTTLVFATVHGDEVTPLYLGVQLSQWFKQRSLDLGKTRVVVAPLVNPDGFFSKPRTRMNARGVDVNRNFSTHDWKVRALGAWKKRFRSDKRRFPGFEAASEPETVFQAQLIQKTKPQKILSIHSPLNFLDYDGPGTFTLSKFPQDYTRQCLRLRNRVKAISGGFYPGSLGNYAGFELGIPTLTLELPSANPKAADVYWKKFIQGIQTVIHFSVPLYTAEKFEKTGG